MSLFSRILVCVDDSEAAHHATIYAARLAREHDGRLIVSFAVDWQPVVSQIAVSGAIPDAGPIISEMKDAGNALLTRRVQTAEREGADAHARLIEGAPAVALVELARRERASLIVVGTGPKSLGKRLLGGITEGVLRGSDVPVLSVKSDVATRPGTRRTIEHIIVGIDDSDPSEAAIEAVLDLPAEDRRDVRFYAVADNDALALERAERLIAQATRLADERGVAAKGVAVHGRPNEMLVAAAKQRKADLIVVGSHGRRGLGRVFLGSVAEHVVRDASTPVLVVPHRVTERSSAGAFETGGASLLEPA